MAKSWLQKYATYEEEVVASAVGITAFATGGQGSATQLIKKFNQVDTVATANDSVKLVPALIGKVQGVFNNTVNDLTVYPSTGEYIDGTINNGFVISPGDYVEFRAYASGRWDSYAGAASGTGTVTSVSVVSANGFGGSVATPNTTPAITITTSVTGILKGNGTAISAASGGVDYEFPITFSTGLTRTLNTVTVNTTQNIAKLSNLVTNGFVKTSGGDGTLSIDTNTYLTSAVTSVTGTANRITSSGGNTPVIDIASTYVGQTSITTLGTVTTGVWNGTAIPIPNGGTGQTTATLGFNALSPVTTRGDIIVRGATNNDRLALGASGTILRSNGTDLVYTTATYPATTTANQILHSTSTNVIGGSANLTFNGTTLLLTATTARVTSGITPSFQSEGTSFDTSCIGLTANANDASTSPIYFFTKSRGSALGAVTIVQNNDRLGGLFYCGTDGASGRQAAAIEAYVDGTPSVGNGCPGRLIFSTVPGGGSGAVLVERWRISAGGNMSNTLSNGTAYLHLKAGTSTAGTSPVKFSNGTQLATPESLVLEPETGGANLLFTNQSGSRFTLAKTLTSTATLNFDLTAVNSQDLTMTVTGAASGDAVAIAIDPSSIPADITFTPWVSAANTVSIRCARVGGGGAVDPGSGTFRAVVFKYQ